MHIESSSTPEHRPQQKSFKPSMEVRALLQEWLDGASAILGRGSDYNRFFNDTRTVTLPTYDRVAKYALVFDAYDGITDWRESERLPRLLKAWLNDSVSLTRPEPIAVLVAMVEFSHLIKSGEPLSSTTAAMEAAGMRSTLANTIARFDVVPYEDILPARKYINDTLGGDPLGDSFEARWNMVSGLNMTRIGDLPARLRRMGYLTNDIIEIFNIPPEKSKVVSRAFTGAFFSPSVPLALFEVLASADVLSALDGIAHQVEGAREARQRKGRFDPHDSVLVRDVFGVPDDLSGYFSGLNLAATQIQSIEALPEPSEAALKASIKGAESRTESVLIRAIANRLAHSPYLESSDFFECMRRLDRCGVITEGVLGRLRYPDFLEGKYLPPFSQLKAMFGEERMPAIFAVKAQIAFGERHAGKLNAPQRFVTALCEEVAGSRSEFRRSIGERSGEWNKSSFERFFSTLGDSHASFQPHLKRVVDVFSESKNRFGRLNALMQEFRDRIIYKEPLNYAEVALSVAEKNENFARWLDGRLREMSPAIFLKTATPPLPEAGKNRTIELLSTLTELQRHADQSPHARAWHAAEQLFKTLPGITLPELCKIVMVRGVSDSFVERTPKKFAVSFDELVRHALAKGRTLPEVESRGVVGPDMTACTFSFSREDVEDMDDDDSASEDDTQLDESLPSRTRGDSVQEENDSTIAKESEVPLSDTAFVPDVTAEYELKVNEQLSMVTQEGEADRHEPVGNSSAEEYALVDMRSERDEVPTLDERAIEEQVGSSLSNASPLLPAAKEESRRAEAPKPLDSLPNQSAGVSQNAPVVENVRAWLDIPRDERVRLMAARHAFILTRGASGTTLSVFDNLDLKEPPPIDDADAHQAGNAS